MEEAVGKIWHRLVSRWAYQGHPEAAVELDAVKPSLAVFLRALGGDGALKILAVDKQAIQQRRSFLQRLAGSGTHAELAWSDRQSLLLPAKLDSFESVWLNKAHYYWLVALASFSQDLPECADNWFVQMQQRCLSLINQYPGLGKKYQALVAAHLANRPQLENLKGAEVAAEEAIRRALLNPGSIDHLPDTEKDIAPVLLWLRPEQLKLDAIKANTEVDETEQEHKPGKIKKADQRRHQAEYQEGEEEGPSLISIRHETDIFSLSEMLKIARPPEDDDDDDLDKAADMADDLEYLTLNKDQKSRASRVRFDLDLPASANGECELESGKLLPEWHYQKQQYQKDFCRIVPIVNVDADTAELPDHLKKTAARLRHQFENLINQQCWQRRQEDGAELDMEAVVDDFALRKLSSHDANGKFYQQLRRKHRDMASLVLADLSLSTEAGLDDDQQVIDVIRDSLFLFAECLQQIAEPFAIYGFSSRKREYIRFHTIKGFNDTYNDLVKGQLQAIKPGFYTRMGAAVREATDILKLRPNKQKLLLILSDGKPNDLDQYEGRYGIEDTRKAIKDARQLGLTPFCLTIDQQGADYLPYLFGRNGFKVVQRADQLPLALPELYSQITGL